MAERDFLLHTITSLETEFKRQMPKEGKRKIWPELMKESDQAVSTAYDWFILNSAYLPSPAQFLAKITEEGRKIRLQEAKQREEEIERNKPKRDEGTFLSKPQKLEYDRTCHKMMLMALDGENERKLADMCLVMIDSFPAVAEEWRDLRKHFMGRLQHD
jgi:hypothetical protein